MPSPICMVVSHAGLEVTALRLMGTMRSNRAPWPTLCDSGCETEKSLLGRHPGQGVDLAELPVKLGPGVASR